MASEHPAIQAFISRIGEGLLFGQVWVQPQGRGYELRHRDDQNKDRGQLRSLSAVEARQLSQFTATGVFRPLKGSPDLPAGWRLDAANANELDFALGQFYPGSVADWFAAEHDPDAATHYRAYTGRQTGMYRITAMVTDDQARRIARSCCNVRFCLKRRLWTVPELPADSVAEKSCIPCLEPCPVLMEFARKAARIDQEEPNTPPLRPEEMITVKSLIEHQLTSSTSTARQADFSDPLNPRRLMLLLEKISQASPTSTATAE